MLPTKEEWYRTLEERHGKELQKKLAGTTAAICGLGGLGSNIAVSLARVGIGKLILIDFDRVDITNLHRQQYKVSQIGMYKTQALADNLSEIAPYMTAELHNVKMTKDNMKQLLQGADIICEAFDCADSKALLIDGVFEMLPEKYVVSASGMAGLGSANLIKTRKITSHFILCGDGNSDISDGTGLVSSRVMLCAAHQAHAVIRLIAGETDF